MGGCAALAPHQGALPSPQSRGTAESHLRTSLQAPDSILGHSWCEEGWARQEGHWHCCCLPTVGTESSGRSINQREPSWKQLNTNWRLSSSNPMCERKEEENPLSPEKMVYDVYSLQAQKSVAAAKQGCTLECSCH